VQKAIKEKKECFRRMHLDRSADNAERYKVAKKTAKRAVNCNIPATPGLAIVTSDSYVGS
jgi:hypothetical protein